MIIKLKKETNFWVTTKICFRQKGMKKKKKNYGLNLVVHSFEQLSWNLVTSQLRQWFENLTLQEMETSAKHNFDNTGSFMKVEISQWLIKGLVNKWDLIFEFF